MTATITVVGLGPGDPDLLTRKAWQTLTEAGEVFLRTRRHPGLDAIAERVQLRDFDHLYEQEREFEAVYQRIVDELLKETARTDHVVYAVPGDPLVGEATVSELRERGPAAGVEVEIVHGVSFLEPTLALLGIDGLENVFVGDSHELAARYHPSFPPHAHVILGQIHSRLVAADVKLSLMNQYPPDHPVTLVSWAGTNVPEMHTTNLHELDHYEEFGVAAALYVPPLPQPAGFEEFQETVAHLRSPQGCPWDREQTHRSLRQHLLEESYEALEAIDSQDMGALQEELGDLLLQLVLQAQIATEGDDFRMADVIAGINEKLIRRHPHVFGDVEVEDVDQVLTNWEHLKEAERAEEGDTKGALDGVPAALPALAQAAEYQSRAGRLGFDWDDIEGVWDKVHEEMEEVSSAQSDAERGGEIGDLLFAVVNLARWMEIDPEVALREANQRFARRFGQVENQAREQGRSLAEMELEELDSLWEAAKGRER
ncbi:MAG: nucleoside triphosphate pyrophosphohydrolase [Anaerolineales bacterium]|nr:nucleoside triphosphate pyrophosphohydrolase [Anaerolineales bacterium]